MADDSKKQNVLLKDVIRELQMLQGGNKDLLNEYQKAGEELADAVKKGDKETADYLKEFRDQAKKDLEKTVTEKFDGKKIDPLVLRTAFAAIPHVGKIPADNSPEAEHSKRIKDVAAGPKPSDNETLSPKSFKKSFGDVLTNYLGGPAVIRDRYRKGDMVAKKTLGAVTTLPKKLGGVLEKLPFMQGIGNFIKNFAGTITSLFGIVGAAVSLSGFLSGWDKAKKWFGENPTFWDKLSSGLAGIAQAFLGLSDKDAEELAKKISKGGKEIGRIIKAIFDDTVNVIKVAWANVDKFIMGFKTLWKGITEGNFKDIETGIGTIGGVLKDVAKAIWDNKLALVPIALLFSGTILSAITAIGGVVGGIALSLGGTILSAFTGLLTTIGGTLLGAILPIAGIALAIGATLVVFKGLWDGLQAAVDEYKKTGSVMGALKAGIKRFGESILGTLSSIWNAILEGLASVVELLPWKGKEIAAKIRQGKIADSNVTPQPSSSTVGAQESEAERRRLEAYNRSAATSASAAPVVIQQQTNTTSNTTAQVAPLTTHSGASFKYT